MRALIITLVVLLSPGAWSAPGTDTPAADSADKTESYRPTHRPARPLIDTLTPLFGDNVAFSTDDRTILVRGPAPTLAEIAELLPKLDHPPRRYRVEFSPGPPAAGGRGSTRAYSTEPRRLQQLAYTVLEGAPLTLVQEEHTQTLEGGAFPVWARVDTRPVQRASLQLRLSGADSRVLVQVSLQTLRDSEWTSVNNTISAEPGQWTPLAAGRASAPEGANNTTYRTAGRDIAQWFIRVAPL